MKCKLYAEQVDSNIWQVNQQNQQLQHELAGTIIYKAMKLFMHEEKQFDHLGVAAFLLEILFRD